MSQQVRVMMYAPWYSVRSLVEVVTTIRDINFNIVEQRQQALERLSKARVPAPFSSQSRFDPGDDFICEFAGDWARKLQQLKSALSHKERDLRTQGVRDRDEKTNDHGSVSDAQQAFWNATTSIIDQVSKCEDIYDANSFESKFRLVWA